MEREGTWGDHVIIYAAANCYETCIHVISSLPHHQDLIIKPDHPTDSSNPLLLGHIHELHYVSLQPKQGKAQNVTLCKVLVCPLLMISWLHFSEVFFPILIALRTSDVRKSWPPMWLRQTTPLSVKAMFGKIELPSTLERFFHNSITNLVEIYVTLQS